jgi:hypothetical protein
LNVSLTDYDGINFIGESPMQKYNGYVLSDSIMDGDQLTGDGFLHVCDIEASSEEEAHRILSHEFFAKHPHRSPSAGSHQMHISW